MYRKSGTGHVLVAIEATHQVNTGRKGHDGKEIIMDIRFNPRAYAFHYAKVIQLPLMMGNSPMLELTEDPGKPGYGPINLPNNYEEEPSFDLYAIGNVYKYKFISDIVDEVQINDKIYFKARTLDNKNNCMGTLKDPLTGKPSLYLYRVPYENIYCAVREGKIIPIGGWTLIEPIMDDWEDRFIKTFYPYKDKHGHPIERPRKEWLVKKVSPGHDNMRGTVAHIGTPLRSDECDFTAGDIVVFQRLKKTSRMIPVEGKQYFMMRQSQILCKLTQNVKVA